MKYISYITIIFICLTSYGQKNITTDTIGRDIFDATYYIKYNTLYKKTDTKTYNYKNMSLGDISTVDITNRLQIVLFYQDYNSLAILDNNLNQIVIVPFADTILFARKGIVNTVWIYNDSNQKLELYDYKSKTVTLSSQPLTNFTPLSMESTFNKVSIIGKEKTLVFDQYLYIIDTIFHQKK